MKTAAAKSDRRLFFYTLNLIRVDIVADQCGADAGHTGIHHLHVHFAQNVSDFGH